MTTNLPNIEVKPELVELQQELCSKNQEISLLSLATTDGFNIKSISANALSVETDKLAAMSSSLFALSNSSSMQLMQSPSLISTIESDQGNILLMSAQYLGRESVVIMVVRSDMSLAQARFAIKRFVEAIRKISA